jgi:hypothetical protein
MSNFLSFPSIEKFRNSVFSVTNRARYVGPDENGDPIYDETLLLPTLTFTGTTKLHGRNAAIGIDLSDNDYWMQSRSNIITPENDNAGFACHMVEMFNADEFYDNEFYKLFDPIRSKLAELGKKIIFYGEWCGKGIQKGVAISELEKMFVIFAICCINGEESTWLTKDIVSKVRLPEKRIFNIYDGPTFDITIDFNKPELATKKLDILTDRVEQECPFSKLFDIKGIGEGIVWVCQDPEWNIPKIWFKVKGSKHETTKGKTKKLAPHEVEIAQNVLEFAQRVVTDARCEQALDVLRQENKPLQRSSLGDFIRWIMHDVIKEESDIMEESNLNQKQVSANVSKIAKNWFFQWEKENT